MQIENLIIQYGYFMLIIGAVLEGETIAIIAGFLASRGYLQLTWVIVVLFLATFATDQVFFQIGRHRGPRLLARRPTWQTKSVQIRNFLSHHRYSFIIGFRFLYGLRTLSPFVIGMSGFDQKKFMLLNALGGLLWSTFFTLGGFLFGQIAELILQDLHRFEFWIILSLAVAGFIWWIIRLLKKNDHYHF